MWLSPSLRTASIDPLVKTTIVSLLIMEGAVGTPLVHVSVVLID